MSKKMIRSFAAFALVLCMLLTNLGGWNLALAEETQVERIEEVNETNKETKAEPQENKEEDKDKDKEKPQDNVEEENIEEENKEEAQEEDKVKPLEQNTEAKDNLGLDIGGEIVPQAVGAKEISAPTINDVFIGNTSISGGNLHRDRIGGKTVRATVYVTLKAKDDTVKATVSVTPKSGTKWSVDLPAGVEVAEGDTVTAYQELNGNKSPVTDPVNAKPSLAGQNKDKLTMPSGEIWIEQTSSNQVNDDEQAEAIEMLKKVNPDIANDIDFNPKKTKFSIDSTDHAYYEVTYTDGSTAGKIEAPNLKINQVTEYSRGATLGSITIVDNVIKGQLAGEGPFDGIKVQLILKLSDAVKGSYCDEGKCLVDKDSSDPVDATVNGTTGEFTYTIPNPDLKLDQAVGVTVKEPHKFKSCSQTTVIAPTPKKTEVKDPRKLTGDDKAKIIEAIKTAYIIDGVSKLPNGTGFMEGIPAVIQVDDSGNAKIFSGNDVAGDWDNDGNFVPEKKCRWIN